MGPPIHISRQVLQCQASLSYTSQYCSWEGWDNAVSLHLGRTLLVAFIWATLGKGSFNKITTTLQLGLNYC